MRFVLAIALVLLSGCGHDSTRPVVSNTSPQREPITVSPDSTWHVLGGIMDAETGEPLIGANVILQYRLVGIDSISIAGAATNVDGEFAIIIRTFQRPDLLRLYTSYIAYESSFMYVPQYSDSYILDLGFLGLEGLPYINPDDGHDWMPMIDKRQTNSRVKITQEDILNLPIPK